jgi:hypothetical protein
MVAVYGTEDGLEEYVEEMGYPPLTGELEAALKRASVWLDATFGTKYPGRKVGGREQERGWPREVAYDSSGTLIDSATVPLEVVRATYEAARRESVTPGSLSPDVKVGGVIKSASVSGAVSVTYADEGGVVASQRPVVTVVGDILSTLFPVNSSSRTGFVFLRRT